VFSTENLPFYTLAGDLDGNYREWTPAAGDYVLKATPYTAARGEGIAGTPLSISFSVINSATVASFTLVDARRGEDIREIKDGDVINLKSLPGKQLNIRANTAPESVGSVVFGLNDRPVQQTENILPYALFGNRGRDFQDYNPWTPRPGSYTITATPYSERNGQGARGIASTITIQIVDEPEVSRLVLYDATSGQDIAELTDNMVLNLSELGITPEMNLNVRAETHPDRVGSVVFAFRGNTRFAVENILPYDLFGDPGSRGARFAFTAGTYTLTATPYASRNGTGKAGIARTVQFTVDDSPAASAVARTASPEMAGRENAAEVPAVRIFPNPTSGKLVVEFTAALRGEVSLRVYDVMGRKTYLEEERHLNGEQSIEVDITSLPARFYILRVQAAGIDQSIKILKQ
jgi:trimeric autotransporter adhesin